MSSVNPNIIRIRKYTMHAVELHGRNYDKWPLECRIRRQELFFEYHMDCFRDSGRIYNALLCFRTENHLRMRKIKEDYCE